MAKTKNSMITSIKGMPDILPAQTEAWHVLENAISNLMLHYGYQEIRLPLLEYTQLFKRSIGEATDIVEKEMFTFLDKNGDSLSLRPEGTASCVRACIEHSLLRNGQQQRLWYLGNMYRYERPQKGRYRQFMQFGVESFNFPGSEMDAEQIAMIHRLLKNLNLSEHVGLEINSLGDANTRDRYKDALVKYLQDNYAKLDEDSKKRLVKNPLRVLDSKNPDMQEVIDKAPNLLDYLDQASRDEFANLTKYLDTLNIAYKINPRLVRGLDYYNRTVYEWITDKLGTQSAIGAGGRYDNLVGQLGGVEASAVGFSLGLERLLLLLDAVNPLSCKSLDGYLICVAEHENVQRLRFAEMIRDHLADFSLKTHFGSGSLKGLLKKADKSGAKVALIIGDEEVANNTVSVKFLRDSRAQQQFSIDEIKNILRVN